MLVIKNFEEYLNSISGVISDNNCDKFDALKYFNTVTKPLFQELCQIARSRLSDIERRVDETYHSRSTTMGKLLTCEVPFNDIRMYDGFEPIIDINSDVDYTDAKTVYFKPIKVKKEGRTRLFSFINNTDYENFRKNDGKVISAVITDSKGVTFDSKLTLKINRDYINAEAKLKKLITGNKLSDRYYPIPLCRRIVDVYIENCNCGSIKSITSEEINGFVSIPIWNLTTHTNKTISRRTVSPYSYNSKRNIYIGEIDISDKTVVDCLAETERENCSFLYSDFTGDKIRIYSENKESLKEFVLYYITAPLNRKDSSFTDYRIIDSIDLNQFTSNYLSEGIITCIVNSFSEVTGYELKSVETYDNEISIELALTDDKFHYDNEMKQFLVHVLKNRYPQYIFKVKDQL